MDTYLHKIPETHLTILRATHHMSIVMSQAAVQLIVCVLVALVTTCIHRQAMNVCVCVRVCMCMCMCVHACVCEDWSLTLIEMHTCMQAHLFSISPVSLSSSRRVSSREEASTQLPSREKLTHVTGSGYEVVETMKNSHIASK